MNNPPVNIMGALGKSLYTLRNSGLVSSGATSRHRGGSKGAHGGPKMDRKQKRIRKTAEASRRRNRR